MGQVLQYRRKRSEESIFKRVLSHTGDAFLYCRGPKFHWREVVPTITEEARNAERVARNADAVARFKEFREQIRADRFRIATKIVVDRMGSNSLEELMNAINRVKRVIEGNGTAGAAVYFGLATEPNGPSKK